jgi:uncharacterized protein (UPF0335 family)
MVDRGTLSRNARARLDRDREDDDRETQGQRPIPSLPKLRFLQRELPPWWDERPVGWRGKGNIMKNGHNDLATRARPYLEQIEELDAERKARCREIDRQKNEIYAVAQRDGLETKSLKAVRAYGKIRARLDRTEATQLDELARAFEGLEFGEHCSAMAKQAHARAGANGAVP